MVVNWVLAHSNNLSEQECSEKWYSLKFYLVRFFIIFILLNNHIKSHTQL